MVQILIICVEFVVVDGSKPSIIGLEHLIKIDLLQRVNAINRNFNIFELYKGVFADVRHNDIEYYIVLDKTIPPIIHPPRRIPILVQ